MTTATRKPRKAREPKLTQAYIPGTEPPKIKEIDKAADALREVRAERMELTKAETDAAEKVRELMRKHELDVYEYDDFEVRLIAGEEKVKVKAKKSESSSDNDE